MFSDVFYHYNLKKIIVMDITWLYNIINCWNSLNNCFFWNKYHEIRAITYKCILSSVKVPIKITILKNIKSILILSGCILFQLIFLIHSQRFWKQIYILRLIHLSMNVPYRLRVLFPYWCNLLLRFCILWHFKK